MAATPKQKNDKIHTYDFLAKRAKPGQKRPPLLSFKEACKEFKVSPATLRGMMVRHTPAAPAPEFAHNTGSYYNAQDFRDWFKGASAKQQEAARG